MPKPTRQSRPNKTSGRGKPGGDKDKKDEGLTKVEKQIVKYLYQNMENKKAIMYGNHKLYFSGEHAVSCLMKSKYATGDLTQSLFNNRKMVVEFCQSLMSKNAFHHVIKNVKRQKPRIKTKPEEESGKKSVKKSEKVTESEKSLKKSDGTESGLRQRTNVPESNQQKEKDSPQMDTAVGGDVNGADDKGNVSRTNSSPTGNGTVQTTETKTASPEEKKKVKGKVFLELDPNQTFFDDAKSYYVWVYEPSSIWNWVIGAGLIFGSIAVCLFPLWPDMLRNTAWYLVTYTTLALIVFLLTLAVIRLIAYGAVYCFTKGRCRFWFLPNLFAEVGFFESFVPFQETKWVETSKEKDEDAGCIDNRDEESDKKMEGKKSKNKNDDDEDDDGDNRAMPTSSSSEAGDEDRPDIDIDEDENENENESNCDKEQ